MTYWHTNTGQPRRNIYVKTTNMTLSSLQCSLIHERVLLFWRYPDFARLSSLSTALILYSPFIVSDRGPNRCLNIYPAILMGTVVGSGAVIESNNIAIIWILFLCFKKLSHYFIKVKVKWSRYRPGVAQGVGSGIALLFHDRGTRRGWVVSSMPRPHFTPGKDPVPILQEAGWAPVPVWTGGKSRPHRDFFFYSISDHSARSQSLYRLSYPATTLCVVKSTRKQHYAMWIMGSSCTLQWKNLFLTYFSCRIAG